MSLLLENALNLEIKEIFLEWLRVQSRFHIPSQVLRTLKIEKQEDFLYNEMAFRLSAMIPAEKLRDETHTVTFQSPKTWWQHFKKQYVPAWLLKRFPVKYQIQQRNFEVKTYALYPELPIALPDDKHGNMIRYTNAVTEKS